VINLAIRPRRALHQTLLTDCDTALGLYARVGATSGSFLLESVQGGEKWGRYSIIGLPAYRKIKVEGSTVTIETGDQLQSFACDDPLVWLTELHEQYAAASESAGLPRFSGGLVGYWGYDSVRWMEPRLQGKAPADTLNVPDIYLFVADEVLVVDNLSGLTQIIVHVEDSPAQIQAGEARLAQIAQQMGQAVHLPVLDQAEPIDESTFVSGFGEQAFEDAVKRIQEYILAGDVMQVVLSQRMTVSYTQSSLSLYRALRHLNPSPYLFYFDFGDFQVVGSSPEILVREVVEALGSYRPIREKTITAAEEKMVFKLPRQLTE
jgi:anthranilate synthase component 1